jgi:hypothetical protein
VEAEHTKSIVSMTNDILKSKRRFLGFIVSSLSKLNLLDKYGKKCFYRLDWTTRFILHPSGKYARLTDWALTSPVTADMGFPFSEISYQQARTKCLLKPIAITKWEYRTMCWCHSP